MIRSTVDCVQKLLSIGRLTVDSSTATIESDEGSCDAVKTCRRMTQNRSTGIENWLNGLCQNRWHGSRRLALNLKEFYAREECIDLTILLEHTCDDDLYRAQSRLCIEDYGFRL